MINDTEVTPPVPQPDPRRVSRSEEQGSLLVDTLTAVLVTAVIMSALAPLAARLFRLAAELIVTVDEILAFSEKLW